MRAKSLQGAKQGHLVESRATYTELGLCAREVHFHRGKVHLRISAAGLSHRRPRRCEDPNPVRNIRGYVRGEGAAHRDYCKALYAAGAQNENF